MRLAWVELRIEGLTQEVAERVVVAVRAGGLSAEAWPTHHESGWSVRVSGNGATAGTLVSALLSEVSASNADTVRAALRGPGPTARGSGETAERRWSDDKS